MKIISPFKDYYDYVAYIYGEDAKHVYSRPESYEIPQDFTPEDFTSSHHPPGQLFSVDFPYTITPLRHRDGILYNRWQEFRDFTNKFPISILSFCGYEVPLVTDVTKDKTWVLHNEEAWRDLHLNFYTKREFDKVSPRNTWYSRKAFTPPNFSNRSPHLVEMSRRIGQPVFIAPFYYNTHKGRSTIIFQTTQVPNLSTMGLSKILPPEKAYQEIDYFVGNLMNPSPDLDPPAKVSDKDKIIQHGFDLKTSFRKGKSK